MKNPTSIYSEKQINSVDKTALKMLLQYFGIELSEQPTSISELRSLVKVFFNQDADKFEAAYEFVVNQKVPEGYTQQVIPFEEANKIIRSDLLERQKKILDNIDENFVSEATKLLEGVEEKLSSAIETEAKKYNKVTHVIKDGDKEPKEISGILPEYFGRMLQLAKARKNILLVGGAGAGKTFIASKLAEAIELDYASQSCSAGVSETAFTGKLLPLGANGTFEYVISDFVRIYEEGGVFLFDEFDAADSNVLVFLNQALANDHFYVPQRIGKTKVKKHKDFIAVAAANTFGSGGDIMYSARNILDAATLDRFKVGTIYVDYSKQIERELIDSEILNWGEKVRAQIEQHRLQKIMSTRFMKDATDMKQVCDWSLQEIADSFFADWSKEEKAVLGMFDSYDHVAAFI
jgi:MoxR-like ATPase